MKIANFHQNHLRCNAHFLFHKLPLILIAATLAVFAGGCDEKDRSFLPLDIDKIQFGADVEAVKKTFGIENLKKIELFRKGERCFEATMSDKKVVFCFDENRLQSISIRELSCNNNVPEQLKKQISQLCDERLIASYGDDSYTDNYIEEWYYKKGVSIALDMSCSEDFGDFKRASITIAPNRVASFYCDGKKTWDKTWDVSIQEVQQCNFVEESAKGDTRTFSISLWEEIGEIKTTLYFYKDKLQKIFIDSYGHLATYYNPNIDKQFLRLLEGKQCAGGCDNGNSFTDSRDGKAYKTVKIGSQTWMAENLNYDAKGSKCSDDGPDNCKKYGRVYDWETAKAVCPSGWHLPTQAEWNVLTAFVGGEETGGKHLKAKSGWPRNDEENKSGYGEDTYGFSALPGGFYFDLEGYFMDLNYVGFWWSANDNGNTAYNRSMNYGDELTGWNESLKSFGLSVRCIKEDKQ